VEAESSVLLSPVLQHVSDFSNQSFSMHDDLSLSVNVDFSPLFLFVDLIFPRFVYDEISSENVALDTPHILPVFVTDASAERSPTISTLSRSDVSHFQNVSHGLLINKIAQHNAKYI
jgi:hypothetical protein